MRATIGIDIGGTNVRAARIGADGVVQDRRARPSLRDGEGCLRLCREMVAELRDETVAAIGVGVPGQVDFASQRVLSGGYVDLSTLPFAERLAQETGLPVTLDNDANMALLGEVAQGAAKGLAHVVLLTIGTGIGGAILDHGRILRGRGVAGQLGHLTVVPEGRDCVCGKRGCTETESSGTAFGLHLAEAGLPAGTRAEALLARGDAVAERVLHRWAAPLRGAIDTLIATLSPEAVIIGGGAGAAMVAALGRVPARRSWFHAPVLGAGLGDDAGVIGAAVAARPKGRRAVLVNGVPASGKSGVAQAIAAATGWPILSLDTVKNPFLVELAPVDRLMNRTLGRAAYRSIFDLTAQFAPDATVIIDAWFGFQPPEVLQAGLAAAGITEVRQIWCHAPPETIGARYAARVATRPAGHPGLDYVPELVALATRARPLDGYPSHEVDTAAPLDRDALMRFLA
ncbi:ROK family protein [Paragemmobacter straminiformis]|uniref:ROK family protein n=1 Tax=Paragemmobacter straminiformis TaxID=2045119 RepID=A0A842I2G5_9RHOB|nr:ROK family protein [Gemmobacter straminiformis]MBC2834442.1 ROK family protein [Gemmobacter straminiformis]